MAYLCLGVERRWVPMQDRLGEGGVARPRELAHKRKGGYSPGVRVRSWGGGTSHRRRFDSSF